MLQLGKKQRRKYCLVVEYMTVRPFKKQIFDRSIIMRLLHRMWRTRSWLTLQPCEPNSAFFIRILCKFFRCKRLTKSSTRARSVDESCWCAVCLIFIAEGHRSGLSRRHHGIILRDSISDPTTYDLHAWVPAVAARITSFFFFMFGVWTNSQIAPWGLDHDWKTWSYSLLILL